MEKTIGKNSISSKQYNRGLILQLIATGGCSTRIELSKKIKLTKMTVTNIISEFIERDIIVECEEAMTEVCGSNPIILKVSDRAPKIIGLLIFRDRIESILCDLKMKIINSKSIYFKELTEEELIKNSYEVIDYLLQEEKNILGIGVAVIGPLDIRNGIILNPPRFYGISNVNVIEFLKKKYEFPIFLDHDNNSAALAEKLFGVGSDKQDFIFLGISNGIGSAIVSEGEVYHNSKGLAAEIGHLSIDRNGQLCFCGNYGCLEMYASSYIILDKLKKATNRDMNFEEFCKLTTCEDVDKIFKEMIQDISVALISSVNMLQPELIVLGHDAVFWDDKYISLLEQIVNERKLAHDNTKIAIKKAYFGKNAQLIGAAANVANEAFKGKL